MAQKRPRGGIQQRGRGARGRGSLTRGGKRFETTRLAKRNDDIENEEISSEDESSQVEVSSGEESEDEPKTNPYLALLQSLRASPAPKPKRRKLNSSRQETESGEIHLKTVVGSSRAEAEVVDMSSDEDGGEGSDFAEDEGADEEDENGVNMLFQADDDYEGDNSDPFEAHFSNPDTDAVEKKIKKIMAGEWQTARSATKSSRIITIFPNDVESETPPSFASTTSLDIVKLKQRLREPAKEHLADLDSVPKEFASMVFNYQDIFYCQRTVKNSQSLRKLVCLHALNHVFKTRDRVIKNNAKLSKEGPDSALEFQDQGYTRPKILFLLPTRNSCARMVEIITTLAGTPDQVNKDRFETGFLGNSTTFSADKPDDFRDLFAGNDDDMFRLGMHFTRKTIKLFTPFSRSDVLLASPLGLRMAIGAEENIDKKDKKKNKLDYDFLSSIEMVIVDQADALLMQNWAHVQFIFEHLNLIPKDLDPDLDISRIRPWYLQGWQSYFRQTIVLSQFNTPELSELMRLHSQNWAGKARLQPEYTGEIQHLGVTARQTFSRFSASSVAKDPDARFDHFQKVFLPDLLKRARDSSLASGTLVFVPSYADFVRLRNFLSTDDSVAALSYGSICEYADVREASRARSHFLSGRIKLLLYTERAHHFWRYRIRGVKRVIFYALPENPVFYREVAGGCLALSEQQVEGGIQAGDGTVRTLFSRYDALKLERVVGSARVGKMLKERGDTFDFR